MTSNDYRINIRNMSEDQPLTATVENVQYVVGGWADYELTRRDTIKDYVYGDRTYITNKEFIEDILNSTKRYTLVPVIKAGRNLSRKLRQLESSKEVDRKLPNLTSDDVDEFCNFLKEDDWINYMKHIVKFSRNLDSIDDKYIESFPDVSKLTVKYFDIKGGNIEEIKNATRNNINEFEKVLKFLAEKMDFISNNI